MNFFGYQEQARKNTAILIALFVLSVILISMAVYFAIVLGVLAGQFFVADQEMGFVTDELWSLNLFYASSGLTLAVILGGSAYRISELSKGGGAAVARMLGGTRLPSASRNPLDRRLLNVVEEMAIASGLPVPPVYLMQQKGINAFAAGFTPSDMVIGITSGAVELLNRDQLQGV
ncbi:MAG: M48 family metalloprotease, partial [Mariprofundaceae bacterium]